MSPALGRIGAAPVAMAPSALGGHCETFAKQSTGSRGVLRQARKLVWGRNIVERSTEALVMKRKLFSARAVLAAPRVITMTESGIRACADRDASGGPVCDEAGASCAPLAFLSRPPPPPSIQSARFSRAIGTPGTPRRSTSFLTHPPGD